MRRFLLVTEKHRPNQDFRDGGFKLVQSLKHVLGDQVDIIQFHSDYNNEHTGYALPYNRPNRFRRRLLNAGFIAETVKRESNNYSDLIFIHVSMLFGYAKYKRADQTIWLFPMFLTPSYEASDEIIPKEYFEKETNALEVADKIITPSYLERNQIASWYSIPFSKTRIIPRGVDGAQFGYRKRDILHPGSIVFCSLGSIKKQKNTLGVVGIFHQLKTIYPNSILKIIGPVQDKNYLELVNSEIAKLGLVQSVHFSGSIDQDKISDVLSNCHIHLSFSKFETFGRAIFETLSCGIPNICNRTNNASFEFLSAFPAIKYFNSTNEIPGILGDLLENYTLFSKMASEVGEIFDEGRLANTLKAELTATDQIIISDFDGTLYHKNNPERTISCVTNFNSYKIKVICTSRPVGDTIQFISSLGLCVNYIIAYSGSIITDSNGNILLTQGIENHCVARDTIPGIPHLNKIIFNGQLIQYLSDAEIIDKLPATFRKEIYQGKTYIYPWNRTKLRAIQKLLDLIDWQGKVICFGDSHYDLEYLYFYDGHLTSNKNIDQSFLNQCEIIPFNVGS